MTTRIFGLIGVLDDMDIDPDTGVVTYSSAAEQVGDQTVTFEVTDGNGGSSRMAFAIDVRPEPGTVAPILVTSPAVTAVLQGQTFTYTPRAVDGDGDTLTYTLLPAPCSGRESPPDR